MHIEIIDDNRQLANSLKRCLAKEGEQIDVFHSISSYISNSFFQSDLCIIDMDLGDGNGLEVIDYLRNTKNIYIPIIIISANGSKHIKQKAQQLGVDTYIMKPFSAKELCHQIEICVQKENNAPKKSSK